MLATLWLDHDFLGLLENPSSKSSNSKSTCFWQRFADLDYDVGMTGNTTDIIESNHAAERGTARGSMAIYVE